MTDTNQKKKVILGIDPGFGRVGHGLITYEKNVFTCISYGCIETPATLPFEQRILMIHRELSELIRASKPDCMAVEKLFFFKNKTTVIDVSQARGVIILSAVLLGVPIIEFTPLQVKQALVGYGRAEKKQIQYMTRILLHLEKDPKPDDAADALALAICASSGTHLRT